MFCTHIPFHKWIKKACIFKGIFVLLIFTCQLATVLTIWTYDSFTTAFSLFSRIRKGKQKGDIGHNTTYYTYWNMMWHLMATFSYSHIIVAVELQYLTVFHTLSGNSWRGRVYTMCHSNPISRPSVCVSANKRLFTFVLYNSILCSDRCDLGLVRFTQKKKKNC